MAHMVTDTSPLVEEYTLLIQELKSVATAHDDVFTHLQSALVNTADWTPDGANELIFLAREYGSFMLRNAMALAVALEIEDGETAF